MGEDFKKILEKIKEDTFNPDETKKYISAIANVLRSAYENCKDDQTKEEIIQEFLEEFEKSFMLNKSASVIFDRMLKFRTYKEIISLFKGNKAKFDSIVREAKKTETQDNKEKLKVKIDINESMISAIRYLIRSKGTTKTKDIYDIILSEFKNISKELRELMIASIQECVATLEEYGVIDDYIEQSNMALEKIGLDKLKYVKRNPIADEQYNSRGELIKNSEDIGVIDAFSRENLEEMDIEDLVMLTAFWESKYFQERIEVTKAMSAIKTLDLWDILIKGDKKEIDGISKDRINSALKKDLALTSLSRAITYSNERNGDKKLFGKKSLITGRIRKQYKKFLEESGIAIDTELEEELETTNSEVTEFEKLSNEIILLECLIVMQLRQKDNANNKKWGTIDIKESEDEEDKYVTIVVENKSFRGPLIMSIPKDVLIRFLKLSELDFPKYDRPLNDNYCEVMARLFVPSSDFFKKTMKQISKNDNKGNREEGDAR